MPNPEANKRDHNYSESKPQHANNGNSGNSGAIGKVSKMGSIVGQIRDIDELKKIAPRVRLQDTESLNELTRIFSLSNSKLQHNDTLVLERTRQELRKYCRTCAGLKLPLVHILLLHVFFFKSIESSLPSSTLNSFNSHLRSKKKSE